MAEELKKSTFDPHLKGKFQVTSEAFGDVEMELVEVAEKNTDVTECFTLLFKGPIEKQLGQGTYNVKHSKLGGLDLFLVPVIHEKTDALYYESVFNRLKEKK